MFKSILVLYNSKVLSVLVPVLNDDRYIQQCLESALTLTPSGVEVCVSDNASTDDTWAIVSDLALRHSNLRCVRQPVRVSAAANFKSALSMSSGDLVFFLGSDDYLVSPGLKGVTQRLAMEPSLAGIALTMCYFSESSGLDLETLPPHSAEEALNGSVDEVIHWMMHHVNHDELVLAVWRKSAIAEALALVSEPAQESIGWWWVLYAMLIHNSGVPRLEVTTDVVLRKRYEKPARFEVPQEQPSVQAKALPWSRGIARVIRANVETRKGSAHNSLELWHSGIIGRKTMLKLLLGRRQHSSNPDAGLWIFSLGIRKALRACKPTRIRLRK
jgi:glycosyltransferase involved in cell wall biosynthesis